jgi:hypothetical protein
VGSLDKLHLGRVHKVHIVPLASVEALAQNPPPPDGRRLDTKPRGKPIRE